MGEEHRVTLSREYQAPLVAEPEENRDEGSSTSTGARWGRGRSAAVVPDILIGNSASCSCSPSTERIKTETNDGTVLASAAGETITGDDRTSARRTGRWGRAAAN